MGIRAKSEGAKESEKTSGRGGGEKIVGVNVAYLKWLLEAKFSLQVSPPNSDPYPHP